MKILRISLLNKVLLVISICLILSLSSIQSSHSYPLYGSENTQIRRLEAARLIQMGEVRGARQPEGGLLSVEEVSSRLLDNGMETLPPVDPEFTRKIKRFLRGYLSRYSISVLDLSDPENPLYAEHNADLPRNPGSVGKIMVAVALFQALADAYPYDIEAREKVLRETVVTADQFILTDSHKVWFWDEEKQRVRRRPLRQGDQGSLWEYLDWMMSASSNAAASTVMKQAMLLRRFGKGYPHSDEETNRFFKETPKSELRDLLVSTIQSPLIDNGINIEKLRQGSFFTWKGKQIVPGTNSYGTTRELMSLMLKMEQGKLVDEFSSNEIKRLLYMTERRIRYASHPALKGSAVYFKSGSLYKCVPEPDFVCKKYHGNKLNLMNSAAIIETPAGGQQLFYIVTLTSNILRVNSAVAHQTLAMRIHRLIEKMHPVQSGDNQIQK